MIKNIIANFFGRFWSLFSVLIFLPLYIEILGFESYSVISFTLIIAGLLAVMDVGLTATLSREFARADISITDKRKTLQTLESIYFGVVALVSVLIFSFSGLIASSWLKVDFFTNDEVSLFIKLISFDVAFQMLFRFYLGGLFGLEKQVKANILQIGWGVIRNGLVVLIIYFYPSLVVFFTWQAISTILFALVLKYLLSKELGSFSLKPSLQVDKTILKRVYKFAGGMMLITLIGALNSQMDKLAISKLLSIESLGYYTLGVTLSTALVTIVTPISIALLPRFTALYSKGETQAARDTFKLVNIVTSVLIFALMANMIIYPKELIYIWTGDLAIAEVAAIYLPYLAISFAMLSLAIIPYNIAIANEYTKLNNVLGLVSLIITMPGYWIFTQKFGAIGAAILFCIVQSVITLVYYFWINKLYLNIDLKTIFLTNMILPFATAILLVWGLSQLNLDLMFNRFLSLLWVGFSTLVCLVALLLLFIGKQKLLVFGKSINLKRA